MALVALQERPEGFAQQLLVTQQDTSGNLWIDGKRVTDGRSGMSKGYAGPDAGLVHPHERAVDMRSEWDTKLGPRKAERMREAWNDNTPVKPDAVDPYAMCEGCGVKVPASFRAQHYRDS